MTTAPTAYRDDPGPVLATLEGVTYTYPGDVPVDALRAVDLEISRGEFVSIVGASGSGKSTLLNILGVLDRPTSGRYLFDGIDIGQLTAAQRAAYRGRMIGFVFQAFHLMPYRTVLENVALAGTYTGVAPRERLARADEALQTVGLAHRARFLPSRLSGGERQRVAIARAIAGRPAMLLCDEPTGNLDTVRTESIMALFQEMNDAGFTVIMVTHDEVLAARAHRTIGVQDGAVRTLERRAGPVTG